MPYPGNEKEFQEYVAHRPISSADKLRTMRSITQGRLCCCANILVLMMLHRSF